MDSRLKRSHHSKTAVTNRLDYLSWILKSVVWSEEFAKGGKEDICKISNTFFVCKLCILSFQCWVLWSRVEFSCTCKKKNTQPQVTRMSYKLWTYHQQTPKMSNKNDTATFHITKTKYTLVKHFPWIFPFQWKSNNKGSRFTQIHQEKFYSLTFWGRVCKEL